MKENNSSIKGKDATASIHKKLDSFIQSSLDKFHFVEPWKELYDITGHYAYYVISNQSTIPDLVIFNKGFNKNDCYFESRGKDYNKFPRKHFILHLKPQRENSVLPVPVRVIPEEKKIIKETKVQPVKPKPIDSDEEDDPEWGDDDVTDFKRAKVDFQEIPKELKKDLDEISIEEKSKNQQSLQVITGDELFQADEATLFNPIPSSKNSSSHKKASKRDLDKDIHSKESQFKIEDAFFKDLCSNQSQNDNMTTTNTTTNQPNNMWPNQRNQFMNQQGAGNNMFMINEQMKQMMMRRNQYMPSMPNQFMTNTMLGTFPNMPIQPFSMRPYPNPGQMNMMSQNYQMPNNPNKLNAFNYFSNTPVSIPNQNPNKDDAVIDDEDEDLMNDFNTKFNLYNPSVFLENPGLIVKKNLFEANWFLMKDNKIIGNYNSEELFCFLSQKNVENDTLEDVSISDYHTDLFFKPSNLFEILKEYIPKLKRKLEMKQQLNNQLMNVNQFSYPINQFNNNYIPLTRPGFPDNNNQQVNYFN